MASLGTDFSCIEDLDADLSLVSAEEGHAQAIARRLITDRAGLFYARSYGRNLKRYLNATVSDVGTLQAQIEREALEDERTLTAKAEVTLASRTLTTLLRIRSVTGRSFQLTFDVNETGASAAFALLTG